MHLTCVHAAERLATDGEAGVERSRRRRARDGCRSVPDKLWRALEGEAEISCMHLTCMHAAERPATDGRAGIERSHRRHARDGCRSVPDKFWRALEDSNL